jgi:hypothetical protein
MRGIEQAARDAGYAVAAVTVDGDLDGAYDHLLQDVEALCVIAPRYSTLPLSASSGATCRPCSSRPNPRTTC